MKKYMIFCRWYDAEHQMWDEPQAEDGTGEGRQTEISAARWGTDVPGWMDFIGAGTYGRADWYHEIDPDAINPYVALKGDMYLYYAKEV